MPPLEGARAMLSWEEDVEAAALYEQGWTITAIANHLGRDRKTIRAYVAGQRVPGQRRAAAPDAFAPFVDYCRTRLGEDRHVWTSSIARVVGDRAEGLRTRCGPARSVWLCKRSIYPF
jgi:transposase